MSKIKTFLTNSQAGYALSVFLKYGFILNVLIKKESVANLLVCLPPVVILNSSEFIWIICFIVPEKPLMGNSQLSIYLFICLFVCLFIYLFIYLSLTPKYFFHLNESLHLFQTNCSLFSLFYCILPFYRLQNLWKPKHWLFHDPVRRGVGLFWIWRHNLLCMHVKKE